MNSKRHSLLSQFILLAVIISCSIGISFCVMLVYVYDYSLSSSSQVLNNLHQQTSLRIEEYYTSIQNEVYALCYSPTLQDYIHTDDIYDKIDMLTDLKSLHSGVYLNLNGLTGIAAFDTAGNKINSTMVNLFPERLPDNLADVTGYHYTGLFVPSQVSEISRNSFAILSPIYNLLPDSRLLGDRIGTVVLTFSTDHLISIIMGNSLQGQSHLILTDADGNIMASSSNAAVSYYQSLVKNENKPAVAIDSILSQSNWHLYSFMPNKFLNDEIKPLLVIVAVTSCIFLSLLFLLIRTLRQKILRPISKLSGFMARVPMDKQPVRFETKADNELGVMIFIMNQMLDDLDAKNMQLRKSEAQAYATELSRKNMEILAYRNQINPHFLYNTLDCICSMAMYHDVNEIVEISESLSTMFRYAVKGDSFTTVGEEIEYVREYASIIGYRFANRISVHINAAPDTLRCRTIRLLIQPLVENAVFHGLERRVGPGSVYVQVTIINGNRLEIVVYDDGIGIGKTTLDALKESLRSAQVDNPTMPSAEKNIGLKNIARRIHLYYNGRGSIEIQSTEETGTTVTIILPLSEGENGCIES